MEQTTMAVMTTCHDLLIIGVVLILILTIVKVIRMSL